MSRLALNISNPTNKKIVNFRLISIFIKQFRSSPTFLFARARNPSSAESTLIGAITCRGAERDEAEFYGETDPEARIPLDHVTDSVHRRGTFPCVAISWHQSDLSVPAGYCSVITMIIRRLAHTTRTLPYGTSQIICDIPRSLTLNHGVRFKQPLSLIPAE